MWTLGINHTLHESAACLLRDEEIVFATAEERLSRVKQDSSFPARAIQTALAHAAIDPGDLAAVGISWPGQWKSAAHDLTSIIQGRLRPTRWWAAGPILRLARSRLDGDGPRPQLLQTLGHPPAGPLLRFGHHRCHALSALAMSDDANLAILVVDGRGARNATSIWAWRDGRLVLLDRKLFPNSLGLFYSRITQYLGFTPLSDEWKVMGLAAYGTPGVVMQPFIETRPDDYRVDGAKILGTSFHDLSALIRQFGPPRLPTDPITQHHRNIAFAAQEAVERSMLALARRTVALAGCRTLAVAGGVAMNCKANGTIAESGIVDRLHVQPAASDEGTALGAAMAAQWAAGGSGRVRPVQRVDWGMSETDDTIEALLGTYKLNYCKETDPAHAAAHRLAQGKVVGWFQGRAEYGPRALGHRSILADPRDPHMRDRVNSIVKFREGWRPFAPSVLQECAARYFDGCQHAPFMIVTYRVRPDAAAKIPGVVHADGTARVQTVARESDPLYWSLIKRFGEITGVPVILNTSFNLKGDPIVNSAKDAIETFFTSGLDSLVIGPYSIDKCPS